MWTEGWEDLREEGDEHHEQFSNTEIQSWDVVSGQRAEKETKKNGEKEEKEGRGIGK